MKKLKILVTGSQGFIGTHLIPELKKKHHVIGWDIMANDNIFNPDIEDVIPGIDVVIHLAALTSVKESRRHPDLYYRVNTLGTARMAELCMFFKKKLIYISSAAVNDPQSSSYADSKFVAELILLPLLRLMKVTILRLENVYGKGMKKGTLLYNFIHNKTLTIDGDGTQGRDFINVKDVVSIIVSSIDKKWNGKVVEVGMGKAISVNEIAELFPEKKIIYKKKNDYGLGVSYADTRELKRLYKKKLVTNLKKDIKTIWSQ